MGARNVVGWITSDLLSTYLTPLLSQTSEVFVVSPPLNRSLQMDDKTEEIATSETSEVYIRIASESVVQHSE